LLKDRAVVGIVCTSSPFPLTTTLFIDSNRLCAEDQKSHSLSTEAEGSEVLQTLRGKVFRRSEVEDSAV
jgi:hypothetical protein